MGGKVIIGEAEWLRCRLGRRACGSDGVGGPRSVGLGGAKRGGEGEVPALSSALPSRDRDNRTWLWGFGGGRIGADTAEEQNEGSKGSSLNESSAPRWLKSGVERELVFHLLAR